MSSGPRRRNSPRLGQRQSVHDPTLITVLSARIGEGVAANMNWACPANGHADSAAKSEFDRRQGLVTGLVFKTDTNFACRQNHRHGNSAAFMANGQETPSLHLRSVRTIGKEIRRTLRRQAHTGRQSSNRAKIAGKIKGNWVLKPGAFHVKITEQHVRSARPLPGAQTNIADFAAIGFTICGRCFPHTSRTPRSRSRRSVNSG